DLVEGGGSLGAVAAAAGGMNRVALQLPDLAAVLVDVRKQAAGGLAVEADGGNDEVVALGFSRPGEGFVLHPVVPHVRRWVGGELARAVRIGRQSWQRFGGRAA